jgi:hypothetical protein
MNLRVGEKILPLKQCYELVLHYSNRDDELVQVSRLYSNEETVVEILKIINDVLLYVKSPTEIENFSKYFIFQNIHGLIPQELMEDWEENNIIEEGDDRILWDYETCSGEIPLEIWSWELYLYDEDGNKYKMNVV